MLVYMKVSGITDVGQDPRPGWIWLTDCSFGFYRKEVSAGGTDDSAQTEIRAAAKALKLTKSADRSSAALISWMSTAEPRDVSIEFCVRPDLPQVEFKLKRARLRNYEAQITSDKDTAGVKETLTVDYEEISIDYWQQGSTNEDADMNWFELKLGA